MPADRPRHLLDSDPPGTMRRLVVGGVLPPVLGAAAFAVPIGVAHPEAADLVVLIYGMFAVALVGVPALVFAACMEWVNRRTDRDGRAIGAAAGLGALSGLLVDASTDLPIPLFAVLGAMIGTLVGWILRRMFVAAKRRADSL